MIDWTRLHDLRADIGEEDFETVAHLFVTEMGERLAELGANPAAATAEDFHFLRGSASNLGLSEMAAACKAAEAACRAAQPPDLARVADAFAAAMAAIGATIPGITGAAA